MQPGNPSVAKPLPGGRGSESDLLPQGVHTEPRPQGSGLYGRPNSPPIQEGERLLRLCNACRYCEGFCAVFPAMERRSVFSAADLSPMLGPGGAVNQAVGVGNGVELMEHFDGIAVVEFAAAVFEERVAGNAVGRHF